MKENNITGMDLFKRFADEIKYKNRFFVDSMYLSLFNTIIEQNTELLEKNKVLYRGRKHSKDNTKPFTDKDIGMPSPDISTSHGRANPYGINYMYLSSNPDTVIAELRPNIGDLISVGQFVLKEQKNVVKLGNMASIGGSINDEWDSQIISTFMMYLILSFSRPIDPNLKELEYLPSQYFAEYCKKKNYDGVMYLSSVMDRKTEKNYNYVLFSDSNVVWESTDVYYVNDVKYSTFKVNEFQITHFYT